MNYFCLNSILKAIDFGHPKSQWLLGVMNSTTVFYFHSLDRESIHWFRRQPSWELYETVEGNLNDWVQKHECFLAKLKRDKKLTSWSNGAILVAFAHILSPLNPPRAQNPSPTGTRPISRPSTQNKIHSGVHSIWNRWKPLLNPLPGFECVVNVDVW